MDKALQQRIGELFYRRWEELGLEQVLPEERDSVLLWELSAEVSNGTFDGYLTNGSGDHAQEAVGALERLEAPELSQLVRRVLETLPGGWCAAHDERCLRVRAVPDRWNVFRALTDEWYDAAPALDAAGAQAMARLHAAYQREGLLA